MLSGAERADPRARRARADSGRGHAARHRRRAGVASAQPRHDGHARRGLGEQRDPGSRPADRARHALRRSRHRQPQDLRAATRKKIHVDIDRAEINKNVRVDVRDRQGPARGARRVAAARRAARSRAAGWRTSTRSRATPRSATSRTCPTTATSTRRTSSTTSGALTDGDALVVTDVGQHQMWEAQYYKHDRPRTLITSGGLGTMGFALPAAIGAKIARPDAEVWVVVGDGGFQMTMCELATRVRRARHQHRDHQQRLPRHGPAVAGVLLRRALRGDAAQRSRLREAGRGVRHRGAAVDQARRRRAARSTRRAPPTAPSLIDFRSSRKTPSTRWCPAGADLHKMIRRPSPIVETAATD